MKKDEMIFKKLVGREPTESLKDQAIFLNAYLLMFLFLGAKGYLFIASIANSVFFIGWSFKNFKLPMFFFWLWIIFSVIVMQKLGLITLIR